VKAASPTHPPTVKRGVNCCDAEELSIGKRETEKLIESCEQCNPDGAEIPFDNIFDRIYRRRSERDGLHSGSTSEVSALPA
jgi:hypothetical protein